jgi:hypothetical protein
MMSEMVPETSVIFSQLTRLIARDDFINFSHNEASRIAGDRQQGE